jgi:hypothetical protein
MRKMNGWVRSTTKTTTRDTQSVGACRTVSDAGRNDVQQLSQAACPCGTYSKGAKKGEMGPMKECEGRKPGISRRRSRAARRRLIARLIRTAVGRSSTSGAIHRLLVGDQQRDRRAVNNGAALHASGPTYGHFADRRMIPQRSRPCPPAPSGRAASRHYLFTRRLNSARRDAQRHLSVSQTTDPHWPSSNRNHPSLALPTATTALTSVH